MSVLGAGAPFGSERSDLVFNRPANRTESYPERVHLLRVGGGIETGATGRSSRACLFTPIGSGYCRAQTGTGRRRLSSAESEIMDFKVDERWARFC